MGSQSILTSGRYSNEQKSSSKKNYLLIPLVLALAIIPLIVHQHTFTNYLSKYSWFLNETESNEFFLGYKSILTIINGFTMVGILGYQLVTRKINSKVRVWNIPLLIIVIFIILSTLLSDHQTTALNGAYEQFETMWVLLTYCLLLYYASIIIKSDEDIKKLSLFLVISAIVIGLIGALQAFGLDLFRTNIGKMLMSDTSVWNHLDELIFSFEKGRVYSTLFNPNYVGVYASLIVPMAVGYAILVDSIKKKILSLTCAALLVIATFGSQSRTSIVTLLFTTLLLVVLLRKKIIHNWKPLMIGLTGIIILFILVNAIQGNAYLNRITSAFKQEEPPIYVQQVETAKDHLKIVYNGKTLLIQCFMNEDGSIGCATTDEQGNSYETQFDQATSRFILTDKAFQGMFITPVFLDDQQTFGFQVTMNNVEWLFKSSTEDSGYQFVNQFGRYCNAITADSDLFTDHGSMFSGRGYIWSRTIPLLKDSVFIGTGPDNFAYNFPQEDYAGKMNYGFQSQVITKPHNMFLQMFVQTGGISCLAFIILYILYMIECIRIYAKSTFGSYSEQIGVLIFVGTIGYMISGLINDSTITVAPVFWTLLGVGFACNRITRERKVRSRLSKNENSTNLEN